MKQLLRNFVSRLTTALPWLDLHTLGTLAFAVVFIGAMVWLIPPDHPLTRALANQAATATITPSAVAATEVGPTVVGATEIAPIPTQPGQHTGPTRTPLPPEYRNNSQQTVGIAFLGAVLALIVMVGVLLFMPREER